MALRTYIGAASHQGLANRVASSSRIVSSSTYYAHHGLGLSMRGYAAASASIGKKSPVTAKGTRKDAHQKVPPQPKRKTISQSPPKQTTSPEMDAAHHSADNTAVKPASKEAATKGVDSKKTMADMTLDEQAEELERLERTMAFAHLMPTIDPWGQQIEESLDVLIPRPVTLKLLKENPKKLLESVKDNVVNWMKNAAALYALITEDFVPDRSYTGLGKWAQVRAVFGFLSTKSVKPDSPLAPFRQLALFSYEDLNKALAERSEKDLKQLTTAAYQRQILALCKTSKNKNPRARLIWTRHSNFEPVRVLSLRVSQGYLGPTEPRIGNRYMIHALCKFDTEQSLEMYNDRGVALHARAAADEPEWISDTDKKESWRVPATRKRVTEYLVLEKRMWVLGPWQFREQLW